MFRARATCPSLLLSVLGACAATAPPPDLDALAELHRRYPLDIPAQLQLAPRPAAMLQPAEGDSALFSLQLENADETQTWFIRCTLRTVDVARPATLDIKVFDSQRKFVFLGAARVEIELFDAAGELLSASLTGIMSLDSLGVGMVPFAQRGLEAEEKGPETVRQGYLHTWPEAEQRRLAASIASLRQLISIAQSNETLAPLLRKVVREPSTLQVLFNLGSGIQIGISGSGIRTWEQETQVPSHRALVLPVTVDAFGSRALDASMLVAETRSPGHACVSLCSAVGVHPDDPSRRVRLHLRQLGRRPTAPPP